MLARVSKGQQGSARVTISQSLATDHQTWSGIELLRAAKNHFLKEKKDFWLFFFFFNFEKWSKIKLKIL